MYILPSIAMRSIAKSISQYSWHCVASAVAAAAADALDNMLPPIAAVTGNNLLQPMSISNNNNTTNGGAPAAVSAAAQATNVGATWSGNLKAGNLNIDLDNLLMSKAGKSNAPALSMNALKTQSPAKTQAPLNVQTTGGFSGLSPLTSPNLFGAQQPQSNIPQNQAAFANFGAFQQQPSQNHSNNNNNNNNVNNNGSASAFDLFQ